MKGLGFEVKYRNWNLWFGAWDCNIYLKLENFAHGNCFMVCSPLVEPPGTT